MDQLVSTEWLAARLGDDDILILDASQHLPEAGRNPAAEFAQAHIPGARFLDAPSLVDETSAVPKALPRHDQLAERLTALGAHGGQTIVIYDDSAVRTSARAWFMLLMLGFEKIAILDGGLGKWRAEGRPLEAGEVPAERGEVTVAPSIAKVRTKADMLANIASSAEQVIDARDAARFAGTAPLDPHGLEGGHIPGARNLHFGRLFAADGTMKPLAEMRAEFEAAGLDLDKPIIATCGSGVTASVLLFALSQLGKQGALYDGSWLEWANDPTTPREMGAPR